MCGIVGIVGHPPKDPELIVRMTSMLSHRGPDDSAVSRSPGAHIGHTRLSILDPSDAGRQPMELGGLTLTFNGEIYNFHELRSQLEGPFRSRSDSEVLLHAFRDRGDSCVEDLHGMFAFAIWDEARGRLFAARDRLGIKPLYYRPVEGGLAFASEIAPLLQLGRPAICFDAISDYLTHGYVPTPKTPWQGIFKLEPASTLTWQRGEIRISRYWQPEPGCSPRNLATATAELNELLDRVVSEHQLSDVPLGVFLSGGLDSATIASFLDRPRTFTLGQPQPYRNEAPAARRVAEHCDAVHTEEIAEVPDLVAAAEEIVDVFDEPFGDSGGLAVWLLSRSASRHVKVVLSGEGGDEVFCGYRWHGRAMSRPTDSLARRAAGSLPTFSQFGRSMQRRGSSEIERFAAFLGPFTPSQKRALVGPRLENGTDTDDLWNLRLHWKSQLPLQKRVQWATLRTYLADGMLVKLDRASMAFSLEVRPPLLDHRLVEWALALDTELLRDSRTDEGKLVLRRSIADRLPPGHLRRGKRGFNLSVKRLARGQPGVIEGVLGRLATNGIVRRPRVVSLTNEQTWALLVLDRWLLRHGAFYSRDSNLGGAQVRSPPIPTDRSHPAADPAARGPVEARALPRRLSISRIGIPGKLGNRRQE